MAEVTVVDDDTNARVGGNDRIAPFNGFISRCVTDMDMLVLRQRRYLFRNLPMEFINVGFSIKTRGDNAND